ncbi:MAG: hypothetical protein ACP5NS_04895 [Candidatus Pacearchaeota archaeon]
MNDDTSELGCIALIILLLIDWRIVVVGFIAYFVLRFLFPQR